MKRHASLLLGTALSVATLSGCGTWTTNNKVGMAGIKEINEQGDYVDNDTGDIIGHEVDEDGNKRDCIRRSNSNKQTLPSCNDIVNRREKSSDASRQESDSLLENKLSGSKLFTLPNGSKIRVSTDAKYNDETKEGRGGGELIVNALIQRVNATPAVFENLFIQSGSKIEIAFIDSDDIELLDPLSMPLNVEQGQSMNINYRKKFGQTSADVVGVRMQARVPIRSIREYRQLARLEVAFKP